MSRLEGKRRRQRDRKMADPEGVLERQRQYRQDNPAYRQAIIRRIREKRLEDVPAYLLAKAKHRAEKWGLEFNIDLSDVVIPTHCPVLGIPLRPLSRSDNSPTIDRLDNDRGYVRGNVAVVSHRANRIKSDATPKELMAIALWLNTSLTSPR